MHKHILKIGVLITAFGMQNCTTAIIDAGNKATLPPLTRTVTYQTDIKPIMINNCITCHAGPAPSAGLDLSNYQNTRYAAEQGNLVSRMNNVTNPMPPNGVLSPETLQIIDKWMADNLPEN